MTDTTKYKNVSLSKETYEQLKKQSTSIVDVDLSLSKTVELASNILQGIMEDKDWVKPLRGTPAYQAYKKKLLTETYGQIKSLSPYETMRKVSEDNKVVVAPVGTAITDVEIEARNKVIYQNRVVDKKLTLQQLGTMYNISRERVRQIQDHEVSNKKLNQQPKEKHASNN